MNNRRAVFELFLISALGLFVELVFIRWVSSELRFFSFYKNIALIAAFLGLGIGFAIGNKTRTTNWFVRYYLPLLVITTLIVLWLGRTSVINSFLVSQSSRQEFIWIRLPEEGDMSVILLDILFYLTRLLLFSLITLVFIPLGQLTAHKFTAFRPLLGYTINVAGSLFGILSYTLISFLSWPPFTWFLIAGLAAVYFLPRNDWRKLALGGILAAIPVALTVLWPINADRTVWSPYYRIDINGSYAEDNSLLLGYDIAVNQSWHQQAVNLSSEFVAANYDAAPHHFDAYLAEYDTPYRVAPRLDHVLVVGAGTGNDVAAGLRAGARQITAVEIDPTIFQLGKELHAEKPYADLSRVLLVNEDARSFFRVDTHRYDLIVFGLLDSHTLFSAASSVRLDNFVYTRESLSEMRNLLENDGVVALSFAVQETHRWIGDRIYRTVTDVFGHSPEVYMLPNGFTLFLITQDPAHEFTIENPLVVRQTDYAYRAEIDPTTDDWPFLYLEGRVIPVTYIIILIGILVISFPLIRSALPDFRKFNLHFFFMGSAFFLLETKSITEMALLFGSTWIVNAVVIAAILTMIILANILVQRFNLTDPRLYYGFLAVTLLVDYFVPVGTYLGLPPASRYTLAAAAQAAPLFFAGMIFAITFGQTHSIEIALGSNLLGSVLGGICEYASLVLGIRSLYLLALIFYLLSLAAWLLPTLQARQQIARTS